VEICHASEGWHDNQPMWIASLHTTFLAMGAGKKVSSVPLKLVIPAKAGIQMRISCATFCCNVLTMQLSFVVKMAICYSRLPWIPAFAGMTVRLADL